MPTTPSPAPNSKSLDHLVGLYYVPPTDENMSLVAGHERTCLAGDAAGLIPPEIVKLHSPPFKQTLAHLLRNPQTGLSVALQPLVGPVELVFVSDRREAVFLVRYFATSLFSTYQEAQTERDTRFDLAVMEYARKAFGFTAERNVLDGHGLNVYLEKYHKLLDARRSAPVTVPLPTGVQKLPSLPTTTPTGKFHPFRKLKS